MVHLSRRSTLRLLGSAAVGSAAGLLLSRPASAASRKGIDYSWGRPSPSAIVAAGYSFVCRYVSNNTTGKNLTKSEADALRAAGLDIVVNWEYTANEALDGYSAGAANAAEAHRQAVACGMPSTRPIYFSVDFDATSGQQSAINAYFDGVASVIGRARTGAYGGYGVINRLFNAGKITWGWQTYAWSGGSWDSRAQLRQVQNGITVGGADCDRNEAMATDFGQWGGQPSGNANVYGVLSDGRLTYTVVNSAGVRTHGAVVSSATLGFTPVAMAVLNFNTILFTTADGQLYRVDVITNNTSLVFETPVLVGPSGWTLTKMGYDGSGHLYGISGSTLRRYTINAAKPDLDDITGWVTIEQSGFTQKTLTATGPDWILGNHADGRLLSYRINGVGDWKGYTLRSSTWQVFDQIISPGGGVYLAHMPDSSMRYYVDANPYDGNGGDISSAKVVDASGWTQILLSAQPGTVS